MRAGWSVARDELRTQLWPLPTVGVAFAFAFGVSLPWLDGRIDPRLPRTATAFLFGGGADAARSVLSAVAGSLITVTSLTFSLTVVTLQLASSQFSPRLLRTFTGDRLVHVTLALFLGTFTYSLTVLRTVRSAGEGSQVFVPQAAVSVALLLALASVLALVLFLAHLATEIRVETMLRRVHRDATATARHVLSERCEQAAGPVLPVPPTAAVPLLAATSGFLVRVDEEALLSAAVDADAVLLLDRRPGSFLVAGTAIGATWAGERGAVARDALDTLHTRAASALAVGFERTQAQDVAFGLRQLTDVAVKALSPGINDPTTAVHALGHASALLCELAGRDLGPRLLCDEDDRLRVALARPDLADLLELAVGSPRRYGAADPDVLARLARMLGELAQVVQRQDERSAIALQVARLGATVKAQDLDSTECDRLDRLADDVRHTLGQHRAAPEGC